MNFQIKFVNFASSADKYLLLFHFIPGFFPVPEEGIPFFLLESSCLHK